MAAVELRVLRPRGLQGAVQQTSWLPYGPSPWSGRPFRGTLVWLPPKNPLCSVVEDVQEVDVGAEFDKPVAHFGGVNYSAVDGAVVLFSVSSACPLLNQLYYAETVLGASGAVVHSAAGNDAFPPSYRMQLSAPVTHMPGVAVIRVAFEKLRSVVVDHGVAVEVVLGWTTSEMNYG